MNVPEDVPQLLILLLFIISGAIYQSVRQRMRGPTPESQDLGSRLLLAFAFSTVLNGLYLVVLGRHPALLLEEEWGAVVGAGSVRASAAFAVLLLVIVPTAIAYLDHQRLRLGWVLRTTYDPTPKAWDHAFRDRPAGFVRVRTSAGQWVGGWYGDNSFASSFPQPRDLFITKAYQMNDDGSFGPPTPDGMGIYVKCEDAEVVEFPAEEGDDANN